MATREERDLYSCLGRGIYSVTEAAGYTRLHASRVYSWIAPQDKKGEASFLRAEHRTSDSSRLLSFLDLVDVLVAGQFRLHGVSLQVIRSAYAALKREFGTEHPFCRRELYTDGRNIFIRVAGDLRDAPLSDALSKQNFFSTFLLPYLNQIEYDHENLLAERWNIAEGVLIDPKLSFGQPVVKTTGTSTFVLANNYFANDRNAGLVADLFNVSPADVQNAVAFEERFGTRKAA